MKAVALGLAVALGFAVASGPSPAVAAGPDAGSGTLIDALAKCLDIADDARRLACTDVAGRRLVDAARNREFVTVDREEVRKTRAELFGFPLPAVGLFDRVLGRKGDRPGKPDKADKAQEEAAERLDSTIRRAAPEANGVWTVTLEQGGVWQTIEAWPSPRDPRPGTAVTVKRGAFGGYILVPSGGRPVRVRRIG